MRSLRAIALLSLTAVGVATPGAASASMPDIAHLPNRPVCPGPAAMGTADCHSRVITDRSGAPLATSGPAGYGPADFHGAYSLPATTTAAQTIAIVDAYDDPTIEADLAVYSETYGLPPCTTANGCFRKVNQEGAEGPYAGKTSWSLEIALDVETAHAICQNCKVLLVEADSSLFSDLDAAVNEAAALGATEISNSYGGPEFSGETSGTYASTYNHPGIAITASAGDNGYRAEYPAASPNVVAVGGTTLSIGASRSYGGETVWSGTGSGCSAYVAAQTWQTSDPNWSSTGCGTKRAIADVAADANPNTGASVYNTTKVEGRSGWLVVGGTSLSAPLIAGVYALAGGGSTDYPASRLYSHESDSPASLHDVTSGSNGSCGGTIMCEAAAGYDGPTGVGTPKGIAAFGEPPPDTTPPTSSASSPATANSSPITIAYTASDSGSGLASVELWAKPPGASVYAKVATDSSPGSTGSFSYTASAGDGTYSFYTRAKDNAGNYEAAPSSPDTSTLLDTQAPAVTLTSPAAGALTNDPTPVISGSAGTEAGDSSTVTIKIYSGTGIGDTLLQTRTATADALTGAYSSEAETLASGIYTARASQTDSAGNTSTSAAHTFSVDTLAPTSQASSPAISTSTPIAVDYTASDPGPAGLASVELWAKAPGAAEYAKVATDSSPGATGSFSYTAAAGDGVYSFYTRATDKAGNEEAAPAEADSITTVETAPPEEPPPAEEESSPPEESAPPEEETIPALEPVFPPPPAAPTFTFGRARNARHGTAVLAVNVSGPGRLTASGRKVRTVRAAVQAAGRVTLVIRPKKRFVRLAKARVTVTYTPLGGSPTSRSTTVRFRY